jgi:hypothetical protein
MVPAFAIVAFLSVASYDVAIYIKPVEDFFEAIALVSFFLLLCEYVQENEEEREAFLTSSGSIKQYKVRSFDLPYYLTHEEVMSYSMWMIKKSPRGLDGRPSSRTIKDYKSR